MDIFKAFRKTKDQIAPRRHQPRHKGGTILERIVKIPSNRTERREPTKREYSAEYLHHQRNANEHRRAKERQQDRAHERAMIRRAARERARTEAQTKKLGIRSV